MNYPIEFTYLKESPSNGAVTVGYSMFSNITITPYPNARDRKCDAAHLELIKGIVEKFFGGGEDFKWALTKLGKLEGGSDYVVAICQTKGIAFLPTSESIPVWDGLYFFSDRKQGYSISLTSKDYEEFQKLLATAAAMNLLSNQR